MSHASSLNRVNIENTLYGFFQQIEAENPNCKPTFDSITEVWNTSDAYEAAKGWTAFAQELVTEDKDSKEVDGVQVTREMALRYATNILQIMLGTYSKATAVLPAAEKELLAPVISKLKLLSAYTWVEMGMVLKRKGGPSDPLLVFSPFVYAESEPVMANQKLAASMCYKACIEAKEDASWAAWLNLGNVLHTNGPRTEVTLSEILPTTGEARAPKTQLYAYHCFERGAAEPHPHHAPHQHGHLPQLLPRYCQPQRRGEACP